MGGKPHTLPFGRVVTLLLSVQCCLFGSLALRWFNRSDRIFMSSKPSSYGEVGNSLNPLRNLEFTNAHTGDTGLYSGRHHSHIYTVTLIILEIHINPHTVKSIRGFW